MMICWGMQWNDETDADKGEERIIMAIMMMMMVMIDMMMKMLIMLRVIRM